MRFGTWARRLGLAVGAVALLVMGGMVFGPLASFAQNTPTAEGTTPETTVISVDEATQYATDAHPDSTVVEVDRDRENGTLIYEVSFADGVDVDVDATTGEVLRVEPADRDDIDDNDMDDCDDHGDHQHVDHDDDWDDDDD